MRSLIGFDCAGVPLHGTLDAAAGTTGILIVSGGNEVRVGTHRGMAMLAQDLASRGVPVFRFDRRGIGDSAGDNGGWESSGPDIAAAASAFRHEQSQLTRMVGLGNCDAATALARFGAEAGLDAAILTNPWLGDDHAPPPAAALRRHYARRLLDPAAWRKLLTRGLPKGTLADLRGKRELPLASDWNYSLPATVILASGDRTAQLFDHALRATFAGIRLVELPTASHSFADAADALADAVHAAALTT